MSECKGLAFDRQTRERNCDHTLTELLIPGDDGGCSPVGQMEVKRAGFRVCRRDGRRSRNAVAQAGR